ncbi:MAG: NAD(+)/NADH kinase [Candidatus Bathyarchaeota archaeon]|nr:MAG: NAD(+)/NADH kinase [Candidatus Bathyarchaeota archaeon]
MEINKIRVVKKRDYPGLGKLYDAFDVSDDGEICLTIGGDGTFLKAAREFTGPILPIREGGRDSLGFNADYTLADIDKVIHGLRNKLFTIEEYSKLKFTYDRTVYNAINDVILYRVNAKTVHCRIYYFEDKSKKLLYPADLKGDGVIFSGQIGSTAYNFIANGPIIYGLDIITVTPIMANYRTSVVCNKEFYVEITKNIGYIEYDGIKLDELSKGDSFTIKKSDKKIQIIKLKEKESFSKKLSRLFNF